MKPALFFGLYMSLSVTPFKCVSQQKEDSSVKKLLPNRPFPRSPGPLFLNKGRCSAFDKEIIFHSHANKTHFHKKGCAPRLILKVRVFGTRKWPILFLTT